MRHKGNHGAPLHEHFDEPSYGTKRSREYTRNHKSLIIFTLNFRFNCFYSWYMKELLLGQKLCCTRRTCGMAVDVEKVGNKLGPWNLP